MPLKQESFDIHYNEQHATFIDYNGSQEMVLEQQGPDGIRLATNDGMHLYGQYQVTAKVAGASGVVTAFYVSMFLLCLPAGVLSVGHQDYWMASDTVTAPEQFMATRAFTCTSGGTVVPYGNFRF